MAEAIYYIGGPLDGEEVIDALTGEPMANVEIQPTIIGLETGDYVWTDGEYRWRPLIEPRPPRTWKPYRGTD